MVGPRKAPKVVVRPGKTKTADGELLVDFEDKPRAQRTYNEEPETAAALKFLSKFPGGVKKTRLINDLIQAHAKSRGWNPDEDQND